MQSNCFLPLSHQWCLSDEGWRGVEVVVRHAGAGLFSIRPSYVRSLCHHTLAVIPVTTIRSAQQALLLRYCMDLRAQRLLALFGLCTVFGVAVWVSGVEDTNRHSLLAASPSATGGTSGATQTNTSEKGGSPVNAADQNNNQCPPESSSVGYKSDLTFNAQYCAGPKATPTPAPSPAPSPDSPPVALAGAAALAISCAPPQTPKTNMYGKPCTYEQQQTGYTVDSKCVAPGYCRAYYFTGQDGKKYTVVDQETQGAGGAAGGRVVTLPSLPTTPGYEPATSPYPTGPTLPGPSTPAPTPSPRTPSAAPAAAPSASSPSQQIGNIANSGSGYTPSGSGNVPNSTFTPSPQLSGSPFNLGSLFGGAGPSGGGAGGYPGGTVAYAPQGDPGYYNRNFESVDAQITFPKAQPSPGDILASLAQNTRRQQGDEVAYGV